MHADGIIYIYIIIKITFIIIYLFYTTIFKKYLVPLGVAVQTKKTIDLGSGCVCLESFGFIDFTTQLVLALFGS